MEDDVTVRLRTFDGATIWEDNLQAHVPANASLPIARWDADRASGALGRYLWVGSDHDRFLSNRHFVGAIKDLRRTPVKPDADIVPTGEHELEVPYLRL